jgi:hypothetical protein
MRIKLLPIVFCLILQPNFMVQAKSIGQKIRRNLANYEQAGPYDFDNELHPRDADKLLGELRGFLWKRWRERRLALVTATFYTIEGDPTKSLYFIESDARGTWWVRIDSESTISVLLPKSKRPKHKSTHDDYDSIDRVEPTSTNAPKFIPIPDDEVRQPQTYRLRLRNSRTNSIRII